jgi:CheY-like chemotaxis protein
MRRETTVLIVEDDDELRRIYRRCLVIAGYHVEDVATGYSAVRRFNTLKPDIILFDLLLPGLGGLNVLEQLTAYALTCNIPVLVVTAIDAGARALNVQCVLKKPVTNERLISAVRACLADEQPNTPRGVGQHL